MTHFLLMVVFAGAVGAVLGAMMRDRGTEAAVLALWIAGGMIGVALVVAWILYLLPA